ncbi:hypothetical protein STCU_10245 [Strigomonas culicis]|uniref:Uncharacterized protein n=1 Tax=Strigomonas culicis TaxID=28005 RepID=S9TIX2_9TRYP|nr:hypothetical protein STCU_10245 [Strigomonas culicis]|eukprot:EPY18022.1 hypothetical protein STCU_10245 [Strigomonas culicis]
MGGYRVESMALPPLRESFHSFEARANRGDASSSPCGASSSLPTPRHPTDPYELPNDHSGSDFWQVCSHFYEGESVRLGATPLVNGLVELVHVPPLPSPTESSHRHVPPSPSPLTTPNLFSHMSSPKLFPFLSSPKLPPPLSSPTLFLGDGDDKGDSTGAASALVKLPKVPRVKVKQRKDGDAHSKEDSQAYVYNRSLTLICENDSAAADHIDAADTKARPVAADVSSTPSNKPQVEYYYRPLPQPRTGTPSYMRPSARRRALVAFTASTEFVHAFR